jgi:hypothetical protein
MAAVIKKPVVCASADRDPANPDLWRWVVTVPSDSGEPIFEECGIARTESKAKERMSAAMAGFDTAWEGMFRELTAKNEP